METVKKVAKVKDAWALLKRRAGYTLLIGIIIVLGVLVVSDDARIKVFNGVDAFKQNFQTTVVNPVMEKVTASPHWPTVQPYVMPVSYLATFLVGGAFFLKKWGSSSNPGNPTKEIEKIKAAATKKVGDAEASVAKKVGEAEAAFAKTKATIIAEKDTVINTVTAERDKFKAELEKVTAQLAQATATPEAPASET